MFECIWYMINQYDLTVILGIGMHKGYDDISHASTGRVGISLCCLLELMLISFLYTSELAYCSLPCWIYNLYFVS